MTKLELAKEIAIYMNKVNATVEIERCANILAKKMLRHELEIVLNGYRKKDNCK